MSSFEDFLQRHGIDHVGGDGHHHARSGWIQIDCPYCGAGSGQYHMGFNVRGAYLNCWRCGPHDLLDSLKMMTGLEYRDLKDDLDSFRALTSRLRRSDDPAMIHRELQLPKGRGALQPSHRRYLRDRGFDPRSAVKLWRLQGIGLTSPGNLSWRIFIPIYQESRLVSWTTRAISQKAKLRYITASAEGELVDHRTILFGEDFCRNTIIVTEGPFDAMRIGPGAVACLGTGISQEQVLKISQYPTRVICLDNEPIAQKKAKELANQLAVFPGDTHLVTLDANDAGSASAEEIEELRKEFLL